MQREMLNAIERIDACDETVKALHLAMRALVRFRRNEIVAHRFDIEMIHNSLAHILDSTSELH